MKTSQSFAPVYRPEARVLVLGSMPGLASLDAQEYYAHPRNCFWRIVFEFQASQSTSKTDQREIQSLSYNQKLESLHAERIALWDVLKLCQREGSLDANIDAKSEVPNDFFTLIKVLPNLKRILFNGKKAESSFHKHVAKSLYKELQGIELISLPSTSPANASIAYEDKLALWLEALSTD